MENFQLEPSTMNLLLWINGNLPMTRSRFLIAGVLLVAWRPNPDVISCDQPVHWATDLPNMFSGHQWYPESCKIRSSDSKSSHHNAILEILESWDSSTHDRKPCNSISTSDASISMRHGDRQCTHDLPRRSSLDDQFPLFLVFFFRW